MRVDRVDAVARLLLGLAHPTVREVLANRAPSTYVRSMVDDDTGVTDAMWATMVELGWVGLLVPEEQGGAGRGLLEMMVVLEEMGRLPLPGPFLSSAVLATMAATTDSHAERLTARTA